MTKARPSPFKGRSLMTLSTVAALGSTPLLADNGITDLNTLGGTSSGAFRYCQLWYPRF
jgi:hypothetical protein